MGWVQRLPLFTSQLRARLLDLLFSILAACLELLLIAITPTDPTEATVATILDNSCCLTDHDNHRAAGEVVVMDEAVIVPPNSPKASSSPPPVSHQYSYSPLPDDHIRLIRILPHGSGDAPIECEIQHHSLIALRKGPHPYEALSYVWGSPDMPYRAYIPTGYIPLTQNLHSALRRLRDTSLPRVLWVDAVCINQTNTDEREAQVRRMAEIYARGSRVVIWLEDPVGAVLPITAEEGDSKTGVSAENTSRSADALEILGRVANGESLEVLTEESAKSSLLDLFQRSWFSRVWVSPNYPFCVRCPNEGITSQVLQEVAAARNILVVCQSSEIDGHAFYKGVITLSKTRTLSDTDERTKHRVRSVVSLMDGASLRPRHINLTGATFSLNSHSLGELIDIYTDRDATDQRDLVYALLGMADDVTAHFSPDYNITWRSLFGQVVRWISGSQSTILAWNGKQTAFLKCPIQAIGYVTQTEGPIDSWDPNAAQLVWVRWTDDFKSCGGDKGYRPNTEDAVKCPVSTNPVQEADIICFIQGRIKPSIVRVFDDYCRVISMVVELPESFTTAGSDRIKAQERLRQIISPYQEARLVWQWGGPQCDFTSTPSLQSWFPNCPDLESAGEGAEESKAARLESTGLLLAAAYLPRAIDLLEKAIAGFEAVGGKDDPRRQNAICHLMSAYDEWFHKGAIIQS